MDISEADKNDSYWQDQFKTLPSGVTMSVNDINLALTGQDFYYFETVDSERETAPGISIEDRNEYFTVFHYSEEFGLPHGKGWLDELPWTIQFLNQMRFIKRKIEIDATNNPKKNGSINPQSLTG